MPLFPLTRPQRSRFTAVLLGALLSGPLGCGAPVPPEGPGSDAAEPRPPPPATAEPELPVPTLPVGPDCALSRVDWLEPAVLTSDTPDFALVSGRAVTMRAFVTAPQEGTAAPPVRIRVLDAQRRVLADARMAAPAEGTVGTQPRPGSLRAAHLFTLKAEWVLPGLQVELTLESGPGGGDPNPANDHLVLSPTVHAPNVLYLTAVPVRTQEEGLASLPDEEQGPDAIRAALKAVLLAAYPLSDVKVRLHAPYQAKVTTQRDNWGSLLGELNELRIAEGNHGYYLGFIKPSGGATVGNSFMPGTVAIVASGTPWRKGTVIHELGHNFNRGHVNCGALDAAGQDWGYNAESGLLMDPTTTNNVMSYCAPSWVSRASYLSILNRFKTYGLDRPSNPEEWL